MKIRLDKIKEDSIIRIEDGKAYVYTEDKWLLRQLKKAGAEPFADVEYELSADNFALVDSKISY